MTMTIERTSTTEEKGTGTGVSINVKLDERGTRSEDEKGKSDVSMTVTPIPAKRGSEKDEEVVLDGEVTVFRRLGPDKDETEENNLEKKQVDDDVKIELVKSERQKLPPPRYQKPEDLNPMEVLEWDHQGVGKLPGSNIKVSFYTSHRVYTIPVKDAFLFFANAVFIFGNKLDFPS